MGAARAATDVCEACWGHLGDKKSCLGMVPKLLTDARETSYWILSSLLTAECSTVELPGNCATSLFSLGFILLHRANSCHDLSVGKQVLSSRGLCAHRSEEHTSELQSRLHLVCRLLLEKKKQ